MILLIVDVGGLLTDLSVQAVCLTNPSGLRWVDKRTRAALTA